MAEVVSEERGAQKPVSTAEETFFRRRQREMVINQRRFGLAYLVLAIGVGVAVGLGIVLIGRGTSSHHPAVGATVFHPSKTGELGAKQIARHVARQYRQADGSQLVTVVGERPNYQLNPVLYYFIRPQDAQYPNDTALFTVGNGIMYSMCGSQANCAAPAAVASPNGAMLLKREALELSFDTFKTDSAVQTVTTLLPSLSQTSLAIIFTRSDLSHWLGKPLSSILPEKGPIVPGKINSAEADRIDKIESDAVYQYEADQGSDGNVYFKLIPVG
jgi:hypothetical protein